MNEDEEDCTCGRLTYWSEVWTDIFKEPIQFVNVECPVHGSQAKKNVQSQRHIQEE